MLYIMRHGRTDWNNQRRLQGRTDIPLNEQGRQMARKAAEEYKDVKFDVCFCSPLIRAKETAEILLEGRDVPIIVDDRLAEMCFGIYEGVSNASSVPGSPMKAFFESPEEFVVPEGSGIESFEELFARTQDFLLDKVDPLLEVEKNVLIIGHGAMNSSIVSQIMGLQLKDFWSLGIENCKLKKLM